MKAALWISIGIVAYAYFAYPVLVYLLSRRSLWRSSTLTGDAKYSAAIVLAVRNEAAAVVGRVEELLSHMARVPHCNELIVVSDGSTDDSVLLLRGISDPRLRVIELPVNVGKAAAVTQGAKAAQGEILVFADVRQRWEPETLSRLLAQFASPQIGGVSGELVLEPGAGGARAVGLYWKYEKWIRRSESALHSTIGVSGCVAAVRRSLFHPIPAGTILDDVYWPMKVVMQGYRVLHDDHAVATDRLPEKASEEFRRKVRTLSGNFQLVQLLPDLIVPSRNPVFWQFVSHKLARLLVPWALIVALITSAFIEGAFYHIFFVAQLGLLMIGTLSLLTRRDFSLPGVSALSSFVMLNLAAWVAFWVWISGRATSTWKPTHYRGPVN